MTAKSIRITNLAMLGDHGFKPAEGLPLLPDTGFENPGGLGGVLRPTEEIVRRLLGLFAVFGWASAPPEMADLVSQMIETNSLRDTATEDELEILDLPQTDAIEQFQDVVGWKLENIWSLAWVLGLATPPSAVTGQIGIEQVGELLALFLPELKVTIESLTKQSTPVPEELVVRIHDLFYCAHNAVRSAQLGRDTVPDDFHPIGDGGAIHERRHSLTWVLSPGVKWNDTALDT